VRDDPDLSIGGALDLVERRKLQMEDPPTPDGTYGTIVLDPPWLYESSDPESDAGRHYPCMTVEEIAAYAKVREWAAPNCMLFMSTTATMLPESFGLLDEWGFAYKSLLTWKKPRPVLSRSFNVNTEHVIFAVKGKPRPKVQDQTTFFAGKHRRGVHSSKPEELDEIVERFAPRRYLSIFDRGSREGWKFIGNEADLEPA